MVRPSLSCKRDPRGFVDDMGIGDDIPLVGIDDHPGSQCLRPESRRLALQLRPLIDSPRANVLGRHHAHHAWFHRLGHHTENAIDLRQSRKLPPGHLHLRPLPAASDGVLNLLRKVGGNQDRKEDEQESEGSRIAAGWR